MRKKLHKRINPANSEYDRFYIVNYLEVGKSWRAIEKEDDRYLSNILMFAFIINLICLDTPSQEAVKKIVTKNTLTGMKKEI